MGILTAYRDRGWSAWLLGLLLITFYILLYWSGDMDRAWKFSSGFTFTGLLNPFIHALDPLSQAIRNRAADRWFLYGFLYTVLVVVFGIRFIRRWRNVRYQKIRTLSVMFFQLVMAFLLPSLMIYFTSHDFYFHYFWPLHPDYLFPSGIKHLPRALFLWGVMMSFIAVPVLTYYYGKRWYCSWVCGCGGLAETFGDSFRHLSSKSELAWKIERVSIYSVLVIVVVLTILLFVNEARGVRDSFATFVFGMKKWYGFFIMAGFAGVVGTGFYPLAGSRIWCRFGCPQAAILGILQKVFSRFQITVNGDQCMSCGNCSTYCEMGIDVRMYAMNSQDFVRASCVGCGICSAVCPRGVLKLENVPKRVIS